MGLLDSIGDIVTGTTRCPKCGSTNVRAESLDGVVSATVQMLRCTCNDCGNEWTKRVTTKIGI